MTERSDPADALDAPGERGDLRVLRESELAQLQVPELTPRAAQIIDVALEMLEEEGPDGVSMRLVAGRLGVRAPSLYKHLPDKQAMQDGMIAIGLRRHAEAAEAGMAEHDDPLTGLMLAYRAWALQHPHLYGLMMAGPLESRPLVRAAELKAGRALRDLLHGDATGALTIWAFAHGLITIELQDRLSPGVDPLDLWVHGIESLRPR
jgi:AcrR family transcriptional regulator